MNTGIQDAYNLAWKLSFVLKGYAPGSLLESYDQERLENAKKLVESTDKMFEFEAGGNRIASFIRTQILPSMAKYIFGIKAIQKIVYSMVSQTGIGYPESALSWQISEEKFSVQAGDRMPYFLIENASIYERLHAPKFHLLTFGLVPLDESAALDESNGKTEVNHRYADVADYHRFPLSPAAMKAFGCSEPFVVLLRPDNYIGFIAEFVNERKTVETLEAYFNMIKIEEVPAYA